MRCNRAARREQTEVEEGMAFSLEALAIHRLEVAGSVSVAPIGSVRRGALNGRALTRLEGYVSDLDAREEVLGKAVSAWWESTQPSELGALATASGEQFERASLDAMSRLRDVTPTTAASGVIVFLRGTQDDGQRALAMFKMATRAVTHAQFHPGARPADAITVEELANVLPEPNELAKAAITPHPDGEADLRVVDVVTRGEPAGYWLKFLGAQQPPKQPVLGRMLVSASEAVLEAAGIDPDEARAAVAERLQAAVVADQPVVPQEFVEQLAVETKLPPGDVWQQAQQQQTDLATPHARISPLATERLRTTIDLGEDIHLAGPATLMRPPRVETGRDEDGWYVKVRTDARPRPQTR